MADDKKRQSLTGCPACNDKPECVDAFIRGFGRRAFHRPLDAAETARLREIFDSVVGKTSNRWRGLQMITTAILTSPKFLYQIEQGIAVSDGSAFRRLTGFEMAARLSFWLSGSTPDNELLEAAERGDLDDGAGIGAQTKRLLDGKRASAALERFFGELYALPVDRIEKDSTLFPFVAKHPEIGASMRTETSTLATHIVLRADGPRVALGTYAPWAPTDPGMRDYCTRLLPNAGSLKVVALRAGEAMARGIGQSFVKKRSHGVLARCGRRRSQHAQIFVAFQ